MEFAHRLGIQDCHAENKAADAQLIAILELKVREIISTRES